MGSLARLPPQQATNHSIIQSESGGHEPPLSDYVVLDRDWMGIMEKLCAICQTTAETLLCDSCHHQWDSSSTWVQKLITLEQHRRGVEEMEEALTDVYITVDGCLWTSSVKPVCLPQMHHADDESALLIQEIQIWAKTGGLTPAEQHAYEIMRAGLTLNDAMNVIREVEQKSVTINAYRHRMASVIKKIRRASQTGEVGV